MNKYFKEDEMKCKCGCGMDVEPHFKDLILKARVIANVPFIITSGARCKEHNRTIGGKDTSSHTKGLALDIKASGSRERYLICKAFNQIGATRFGIDKSFVHVDIDQEKAQQVTWLY